MRKIVLIFQTVLILLTLGCDQKPATPTPPAAITNAAPATNAQASAEERESQEEKVAHGEKAIAVTVHPLATQAALDAMRKGGNAIDGAVAAALTLGVVDGFNSGIGGGCFILIKHRNGAYNAIDGREMAPGLATKDMFIREGKADPQLSQVGALAIGTPGALAAYDLALRKWGKLPMKEHLLPAAKIAEEGFAVSKGYAATTRGAADDLIKFPASAAAFLHQNQPLKAGHILKQPDLAKTYRSIANEGLDWFYRGPFAKATEEWMKKNAGIMSATDFMNYQAVIREPIFSNYRGYTIATMPPPSSGGIHVIQILKMCETKDLWTLRRNGIDVIHFVAEAMKLAFADRAHWLGDPDYVKVPKGLISKKYCYDLAAKIQMTNVIEVPSHGVPDNAESDVFRSLLGKHTTHFAVADDEGSSAFSPGEIKDVPGLAKKLGEKSDPVSAFLFEQFNKVDQGKLAEPGNSANAVAQLKTLLAENINRIVATKVIFDEERFKGIELRPRTQQLLQNPSDENLGRVNRALLEDAYPEEFLRYQGGNWVAVTATINTSFGSKVVIPGTGVVMNNEMDDFAAQAGVPNFFGVVGAEANAVGPFKRPLSSMTPTIVSKEGEVYLAVGAAGGPTIINQVAQSIINYIDMRMSGGPEMVELELSIHDALRTPRFHHQWKPDELKIETGWSTNIMVDLEKRGHKLKKVESFGACQIIAKHPEGRGFIGAADPRGRGKAEGF